MKYFFEGKVKSISIENSSSTTEITNIFNVEFKNSQPTQWSDKVLCIEETTNKNKKLLLIEKLIFTIKNESLFNFISMHSKETLKVHFVESTKSVAQKKEKNKNPNLKASDEINKTKAETFNLKLDKKNDNSKQYEITKVELIYG